MRLSGRFDFRCVRGFRCFSLNLLSILTALANSPKEQLDREGRDLLLLRDPEKARVKRRLTMSMKPQEISPVPEETARVARAANPKGNVYMRMRDELGSI